MSRTEAAAIVAAMLCLSAAGGQGKEPAVAAAEALAAAIRAQTGAPIGAPTGGASPAAPVATAEVPYAGPRRRDGYWAMTSHNADGSPKASQSLCVGGGSEETFNIWEQLTIIGNCSRKELARAGAGWTFDARCELMGMVSESKGTISGDFRDRFRVDLTVVTDGRPDAGSIRGEHKGACPAAFKAGDLVSDGRVLMNVLP